jgi:acyl carrier protein
MVSRQTIKNMVIGCASREFTAAFNHIYSKNGDSTILYGPDGFLDSMGLSLFVIGLEQSIANEFNRDIVLANEKAFSEGRSPFRTIKDVVDYVEEILNDTDNGNK